MNKEESTEELRLLKEGNELRRQELEMKKRRRKIDNEALEQMVIAIKRAIFAVAAVTFFGTLVGMAPLIGEEVLSVGGWAGLVASSLFIAVLFWDERY